MSAVGVVLASVLVIQAPACDGAWERAAFDPCIWTFGAAIGPGGPSVAEVRDPHGKLLGVLRDKAMVHWRCVPYRTGPVS